MNELFLKYSFCYYKLLVMQIFGTILYEETDYTIIKITDGHLKILPHILYFEHCNSII